MGGAGLARALAAALWTAPAAHAAAAADAGFDASPFPLRPAIVHGETHMGVRLLGTVEIAHGASIGGERVTGLSALGWDDDEGLLYALSDRGALFHLRPRFEALAGAGDVLVGLEPVAVHRLRDAGGRPLPTSQADAEGLAVVDGRNGRRGDAALYVSLERRHGIAVFTADGTLRERLALPPPLDDARSYASPNQGLEAVTVHRRLGVLTAPERALGGGDELAVVVRALHGGAWRHELHGTPNASVVALEALPDGTLLVLERGHGIFLLPVVIALQHADEPVPGGDRLAAREIAVFDTSKGWNVDNFEGLARHQGQRFFMVSDDNDKAIQRSLLVYFELGE